MSETPGKMYALAAVLSFLAIAATVLRFYARYIKKAGYSWDDMVLLPALIFTIATAVCIICGTALGDMGRHTKTHSEVVEGVTYLVPDFTHRTHVFQMIWALQMPPRRKLAVCGIFLLGFLYVWHGKDTEHRLMNDRTVGAGIAKLAVYYDMLAKINDDPNAVDVTWLQTPLVYWPLVESSCGIIGACLPLMRPLFAGAASRGFMRDLQSVDIPTSERSDTLWNKSEQRAVDDWNSLVSTVRYGSDSLGAGEHFKEKKMPSLPSSSLDMLKDTPTQGLWMKQPRVPQDMV
ncbi:MAG: hypothetical protein Q9203_004515 [Teloschistes exilis]